MHRLSLAGRVLAATLLACGGAAPALAAPAAAPAFIPAGERADAPVGFVEMCARDPLLCQAGHGPIEMRAPLVTVAAPPAPGGETAQAGPFADMTPLSATAAIRQAGDGPEPGAAPDGEPELRLLRRVNSAVNRRIRQVSDLVSAGVEERWQRPDGVGDCEDIAIEKRIELIDAGFPPSRLFFAVAYIAGYGLHTVLVARLEDGDRLLDSLSPHVLRWSVPDYRWLRLQSAGNPVEWTRIGNRVSGSVVLAAARPTS